MELSDEDKRKLEEYMQGQGIHNLDQAWAQAKEYLLVFQTTLSALQEMYPDGSEKDSILWITTKKALGIVILECWNKYLNDEH